MLVEIAQTRIAKIKEEARYSEQDPYKEGLKYIKENSDLDAEEIANWIAQR